MPPFNTLKGTSGRLGLSEYGEKKIDTVDNCNIIIRKLELENENPGSRAKTARDYTLTSPSSPLRLDVKERLSFE